MNLGDFIDSVNRCCIFLCGFLHYQLVFCENDFSLVIYSIQIDEFFAILFKSHIFHITSDLHQKYSNFYAIIANLT